MPTWLIVLIGTALMFVVIMLIGLGQEQDKNIKYCHSVGKSYTVVEGKAACIDRSVIQIIGEK